MVLSFCLSNAIPFEANKIDYLFGDFKEDPILTDGDISISGRYVTSPLISLKVLSTEVIRYLSDKYVVSCENFYQALNAADNNTVATSTAPDRTQNDNFAISAIEDIDPLTFVGSKEEFRMKIRSQVDQYHISNYILFTQSRYLQWNEFHIKHPIQQIFWKETYPRFNATNKIRSVKVGSEKTSEKENTVGVKSTTIAERMSVLTLENSYTTLAESLAVLDSIYYRIFSC
jgi:hypothetical protein